MSGVQHVPIGPDEAEQRLDRWFRRLFPQVTQGRLERMCRKGEVRVDGARAKTSTRVRPGQTVRVPPLPDTPVPEPEPTVAVDPGFAETLQAAVVHRDDAVVVLNKPAGLAVQGGTGQRRHVAGGLAALRFGREEDPRLVHRLDKDTSGLLVLARTGAAAVALGHAFRGRSVEKIYLAAVAGEPQPPMSTVRYGLVKAGGAGDERMRTLYPGEVAATEGARHAQTDYRVLEAAGGRVSAVALRPVTGRTHQLRAHMAALGTPIAGDGKYGGRSQENLGDGWGAGLGQGLSRKLHLHAARLVLPHPTSGAKLILSAPLPPHMARTWEFFGWEQVLPDPVFDD